MEKKRTVELKIQITFILFVFIIWQAIYAVGFFPRLMFPSLMDVCVELCKGFSDGSLFQSTIYSLGLLMKGLLTGIIVASLLSAMAIIFKPFFYIFNLVVSVFDLIPGVAILPLGILWFGIGETTVIFIVFHGVVWPLSRNILDGFCAVPSMYIEAGKNFGLSFFSLVFQIYVPAAFSSILSGIRVGWARAWRGLIAIEMIFGTTGTGFGIGWFIYLKRTNMNIAGVLAALIIIIAIGIIIEYLLFRTIELFTVRKWGLARG